MKTLHRDIVGGFIFSKDGKLLLGKNRNGGVYEGKFVVPGGGVNDNESKEKALHREMFEETGIDITNAIVTFINESSGESEKTMRDTNERVIVKMSFYDYRIDLKQNSNEVILMTEDDWIEPQWFTREELKDANLSDPTRNTLASAEII